MGEAGGIVAVMFSREWLGSGVAPRRVSCVGRRRLGGVSRGNRGSNVFALIGGCYFVSGSGCGAP